ncbi:MAG: aminopeptidase, partial [Spirochaetaceae bacterium]|nr:aminopeptidase [Spirochaetaceae bacterium]
MAEEKTKGQKLSEELCFKLKNSWETADEGERREIEAFAVKYKAFLDAGKTEREICALLMERLRKSGFIDIEQAAASGKKLLPGA